MNDLSAGKRLLLIAVLAVLVFGTGGLPIPGVGPAAGPRDIVIVYETNDATPAFARLLNGLRSGDHAAYLKGKGHTLDLVDFDARSVDGVKAAVLEKYGKDAKFKRSLVIADKASGRGLFVGELTDESTAAAVIEYLKRHGG